MTKPHVVAITGTIASGKSLVGRIITDSGYLVIDTDKVVHDLFATSPHLRETLVEAFGNGILAANNTIDRQKLGSIVFADEAARKKLEAIVHPAVLRECERIVGESNQSNVFILVPLLFEAGLEKRWDEVWTVVTEESILRQRLKQRNNLSDHEIDSRLSAQLSQEEKAARADKVINNSGTIEETERQVRQLLSDSKVAKEPTM